MIKKIDYIIVGQGIAGTLLSHFLLKKHKSILVVDNIREESSSRVAAGVFNPITGRRLVKTWLADEILPFAERTYNELEYNLKKRFYFPKSILKLFATTEEYNEAVVKSRLNDFSKYMSENRVENGNIFKNDLSTTINKGGNIDISVLIDAYKQKLKIMDCMYEGIFEYDKMQLIDEGVLWNDYQASKVIFCEGYKTVDNPYFSWLPLVPAKGEILTILAPDLQMKSIISKGIFILPIENNLYKVGATYTWNPINETITADAKDDLCAKLDKIISCKYTVIHHQAGIRPTVKDRRPLIGLHPKHSQLGIFNGLGTKGVSLAPFFANQFVDFLEENGKINEEADIRRFN